MRRPSRLLDTPDGGKIADPHGRPEWTFRFKGGGDMPKAVPRGNAKWED
jgi:hypothetical protein